MRGLRVFQAFRSRDFALLWSGQTVSQLGDMAFLIAIGWRTQELGQAGGLGLVLALQAIGMLSTLLLGGVWADRYERKRLMILSDVVRFAAVGVICGAEVVGTPSIGLLAAASLAVGLGTGLFQPAYGGIVPLVVEPPHLGSASALVVLSRRLSAVAGPALAGAVYDVAGPAVVFGFNALSFLVSAALLLAMRPRALDPAEGEGTLREIWAGVRYVAGDAWLWITIALFSVVLMIQLAPERVLMPELMQEHFGRGVGAYGLLFSLFGLGMAAGALVFGQWGRRRRRGAISYAMWTAASLCIAGMALSPWYELAGGLAVARGFAWGFSLTVWNTMLMQLVPEHLLARVLSVDYFGSLGLMPVGMLLAAGVAGVASASAILAAGGVASAVLFAIALLHPKIRAAE